LEALSNWYTLDEKIKEEIENKSKKKRTKKIKEM